MVARLLSFGVWAVVAATTVFWGLRLATRPQPLPPQAAVAVSGLPQGGDLTRLFGAPPPPVVEAAPAAPPPDARFKLLGVVAPAAGQHAGLALLAVDGRPARALAPGERVDGDWTLRSIAHRRVELTPAAGGPSMVLELPVLAEAARGTLAAPAELGGTPSPPAVAPAPPGPPTYPLKAGQQPVPRPAVPALPNLQPLPTQQAPAPFGVTPQPGSATSDGPATR